MSVSELEECLCIYQPTLLQQLRILRTESLVDTRKERKRIFYFITNSKALTVLSTLYKLYCQEE